LFSGLSLVSLPRLLLPCIHLRPRRGRSEGWRRGCARGLQRERKCTLSLSIARAESALVPFSFLFYAGC
jgi:hypothetical protein